jgi:hypothetical protein
MKVIMSRQNDRPLYVTDPKDNVLVDIENNHMELTMEDNSIFILPSVESYYRFIGDAQVCYGDEEIFLNKLMVDDYKITLTNYEMENGEIVSSVVEMVYGDEKLYLLKIKPIEEESLHKIIEEGM